MPMDSVCRAIVSSDAYLEGSLSTSGRYRQMAFCATARTSRCRPVSPSSTARIPKDFASPGVKTSGFIRARWRYTSVASRVAVRASSERPAAFRPELHSFSALLGC